MGARSIITKSTAVPEVAKPAKVFHAGKRVGRPTDVEKSIVAQFIADQTKEVTETQIGALSRLMRRTKDTIRGMVEQAREDFQSGAGFYVAAHRTAVQKALDVTTKDGEHDAKALDAAMRGSQWALENMSAEGIRITDKPNANTGPASPRIMVNIAMGGLNKQVEEPAVDVVAVEVQDPPKKDPEESQ